MKLEAAVDLAISEAKKASGTFRHGAVIMSGKHVISAGRNHIRNASDTGLYSIHAEMCVLWKIPKNTPYLKNLKMVIVRVTNDGSLANSRPCAKCMHAIKQFRVHTIAYSTGASTIVTESVF